MKAQKWMGRWNSPVSWGQPRTAETLGPRKDGISDHQEPAGFFSECRGPWPDPHTQGGRREWLSVALAVSLTRLSLSQSICSSAVKAPVQVIVLRALTFLLCAFLLATALYGTSDPFAPGVTLPPALPPGGNGSTAPDNGTAPGAEGWRQLLGLLPEHTTEKLRAAWAFGQSHQTGVVALGLLTCLLAMLLAGRIRCVWGQAGRGSAPGLP